MRYPTMVSIAALVATSALLAGCSNASNRYVLLTSGTYKGAGWQLFAWQQEGYLCMEVEPAGFHPDQQPPVSAAPSGGACRFDDIPTAGFYTMGPGPEGSMVSFGPLPSDAMQIRVAADEILTTMPMPREKGLPAGRYWINMTPSGGPGSSLGTALFTPEPLDAAGRPVPFQAF